MSHAFTNVSLFRLEYKEQFGKSSPTEALHVNKPVIAKFNTVQTEACLYEKETYFRGIEVLSLYRVDISAKTMYLIFF